MASAVRGFSCYNLHMSADREAFINSLDNHIRKIIQNPHAIPPDDLSQRRELRSLMDRYVDQRIAEKLKELGIVEKK